MRPALVRVDRPADYRPSSDATTGPTRARLGKHARGKGCLYVNKLADIDLDVLEEMIALSWKNSFERYPA